jgi:hypothetical protein
VFCTPRFPGSQPGMYTCTLILKLLAWQQCHPNREETTYWTWLLFHYVYGPLPPRILYNLYKLAQLVKASSCCASEVLGLIPVTANCSLAFWTTITGTWMFYVSPDPRISIELLRMVYSSANKAAALRRSVCIYCTGWPLIPHNYLLWIMT